MHEHMHAMKAKYTQTQKPCEQGEENKNMNGRARSRTKAYRRERIHKVRQGSYQIDCAECAP